LHRYASSFLIAMYTSIKTTGASPLVSKVAMQSFCTTYFGLWVIQNFLRPARMALSVAISPWTDKLVVGGAVQVDIILRNAYQFSSHTSHHPTLDQLGIS
jgi:hypothetical protein